MLLATRPIKCPRCKEFLGPHDLTSGERHSPGIGIFDCFASGGSEYIHAEGDCFVKTKNDVVMDVDTVVTAIKGAKVEMTNPTVDKKPSFPDVLDYSGIEISSPKVFILQSIISNVIGVKSTLSMTAVELKTFFNVVQNRIYNGLVSGLNGGALTGIEVLYSNSYNKVEIIDSNGALTDDGVKLLKFVAQKMV